MNKKEYIRDGRAPIPEKELTSKIMSSVKDKNTRPELALRKELWRNDIKGYRLHWKKVPGRPDIAFPSKKLAIFVNGCFWHRCPYCTPNIPKSNSDFWTTKFIRNVERDENKINQLKAINWKSIVIWECQIKTDIRNCVERINKILMEL